MYEKTAKGWLKHLDFILLDYLCLLTAFFLSYLMRFNVSAMSHGELFVNMITCLTVSYVITVFVYEGHKDILRRGYYAEFTKLVKQTFVVGMLSVFMIYITKKSSESSRFVFLSTFSLGIILSYIVRNIRKAHIKQNARKNIGGRSLVLVCMSYNAEELVSRILEANYGINVAGVVIADKNMTGREVLGIPVVADRDTAIDYICRNWVDEIFIGKKTSEKCQDFIGLLKSACRKMGITSHTMLLNINAEQENAVAEKYAGFLVLTQSVAVVSQRNMMLKRFMDICGGLVGCFITVILFIIFAPLIFIASPGPIFFSQQRVGKNGKLFRIYKFRSMYMDAEERKKELMKQNKIEDGMMFKMDNDPRIIKGIGHIIRDFSIDEFPQFFNVLMGDMSLVGTRPPTLDEWEKYELHHRKRLAIKPGITGMWQVSGRSNITDFEEIVKLDTKYIEEWSIGLDIKIILKTIAVVLKKEGSQ